MKSKKKTIAVLYGGKGVEHDISALGGKFVLSLLDCDKFKILPVFIDRQGEWFSDEKARLPVSPVRRGGVGGILKKRRFVPIDAAFPVLHGDFGEDGRIQGLLDTLGIPFVGCDTLAGAVCSDKSFTKSIVRELGIPTLPWCSSDGVTAEEFCCICEEKIGYPMFIKPSRLGSSVGAGIAENPEGLSECVRYAYELGGGRIMAEKYLEKPRELECAFLELEGKRYISPPGEIRLSEGFYGYSEKYSEESPAKLFARAEVSSQISSTVCSYADTIARALGLRGLARIDFFLLGEEIYFNEINTMPGMTEASLYPKMAEGMGITSYALINGLVKDTLGGRL